MPNRRPSKQRLEELIALARTYRGWSSRDLARELGRDVHHLVPDSGIPKLDIVIALAEALDWTVQDVVDDLCGNVPAAPKEPSKPRSSTPPESNSESSPDTESFPALNRAAWDALQGGEYVKAAAIAQRAFAVAQTPEERATACVRELGAWDAIGRFVVAIECAQRGLREQPPPGEVRILLRNNLAYFHYLLGQLDEASGIATEVIAEIESGDVNAGAIKGSLGFAYAVHGFATRARIVSGAQLSAREIDRAVSNLERAVDLLSGVGESLSIATTSAAAEVARGALLSLLALVGRADAEDVLAQFETRLDSVVDPQADADKHRLEAVGWWCVFGCEVGLRVIADEEAQQHCLALFTNKADEIATATRNWALKERVWRLELQRRVDAGGMDKEPWILDHDDARDLAGAMARFPHFRRVGWAVFRSAEIGDQP